MMSYAMLCGVLAILAGLFGYVAVSGVLAWITTVFIGLFLVKLVASMLFGSRRTIH
jgi:uncharacterized membrane protein YtjA (UPF0391 family)